MEMSLYWGEWGWGEEEKSRICLIAWLGTFL